MKKVVKCILTVIAISLLLFSCDEERVTTYYKNGKLRKEYFVVDGKKEGTSKEYFPNGNLKEIHRYINDKPVDSSLYYYDSETPYRLKQIRYWSDSTNFTKVYNRNKQIIRQGRSLNSNPNFRIGKWKYFLNKIGDSIIEYKTIDGEVYSNQVWVIANGDTLINKGNYFSVTYKDTIQLGELAKMYFFLDQPFLSYNSESKVVIPKISSELKADYSNLFDIESYEYPSLKNDGIPRDDIPEDVPLNHNIAIGLDYKTPGQKRVRGVLIEYIKDSVKSTSTKERRLYFDETFFIKDTVQ